jgi:transcriptional regulator with XRE-family HTH domain
MSGSRSEVSLESAPGTIIAAMATRQRRATRGALRARYLLRTLGEELRHARLEAGLSQSDVGRTVGVSGTHVGRLERGEVQGASVDIIARLCAVLGMRLGVGTYPEASPLRDEGSARLLARFQRDLPTTIRLRTEVSLRAAGELRAWDAELAADPGTCKLEAETALHDLQSQVRKITRKQADDDVDVVILLVAETKRNRRVLGEFRELLRERFPLDTREVMACLKSGRLPPRSGIVIR